MDVINLILVAVIALLSVMASIVELIAEFGRAFAEICGACMVHASEQKLSSSVVRATPSTALRRVQVGVPVANSSDYKSNNDSSSSNNSISSSSNNSISSSSNNSISSSSNNSSSSSSNNSISSSSGANSPRFMRATASSAARLQATLPGDQAESSSSSVSACGSPRMVKAMSPRVAALRAEAGVSTATATANSPRVPHFMQATASAAARLQATVTAQANGSSSSSDAEGTEAQAGSSSSRHADGNSGEQRQSSVSSSGRPRYLERTRSEEMRVVVQGEERKQRAEAARQFRDSCPKACVEEARRRRVSADKDRQRVGKGLRSLYPEAHDALQAMHEHGRHVAQGQYLRTSQWHSVVMAA